MQCVMQLVLCCRADNAGCHRSRLSLGYTGASLNVPGIVIGDPVCSLPRDYGARTIARVIMLCLLWCFSHML